jgi:hypothetical protein
MNFPTNDNDVRQAVLKAFVKDPRDPYLARRMLEEQRDNEIPGDVHSQVAQAVATWASHDPAWFVHAGGLIHATHCFAWPKTLFAEVERLLTLQDLSLRHLIMGRLWWEAKLRRPNDPEFASRAVEHFLQVDERHRFGKYYEELAEALAVEDPARLEALADTLLASVSDYALPCARQTLLEGAARAQNWVAYDRHRAAYRELQERGWTRGHDDCEVLNLDGLAALSRGQNEAIPAIVAEMVERGRNVDFLGTPETLRLVRALMGREEHLACCLDYLAMIQKQRPSPDIAKLLANVEVRLRPAPKTAKATRARRATAPEIRKKGKPRK